MNYQFPQGPEIGMSDERIARAAEVGRAIGEAHDAASKVKTQIIIAMIEAAYDLESGAIKRYGRVTEVAIARHVAYTIARDLCGYSYPRLGLYFDRHHTSIMSGIERLESLMERDRPLRETYLALHAAARELLEADNDR